MRQADRLDRLLHLGNVVVDVPLSDTMFVVAHFHMVMGVAPIMVVFGAIYHWYPKITGRMLDEVLGRIHFWVTFIGAYAIFFPMHYVGLVGVPRRYFELGDTVFIPPSVHDLNMFISVAALVVGAAQMVFLFNVIWSLFRGREAGGNPWRATTLEWQTPQTPPAHGNWARSFRSSIAGPTTTVYPALPKTSYPRTSRLWPECRGRTHECGSCLSRGNSRNRHLVAVRAEDDVEAMDGGRHA